MHDSRIVKLGLIQMSMIQDKRTNLQRALGCIARAKDMGADIVCLPELFNTLYFPQDRKGRVLAEPIPGETTDVLGQSAKSNGVVLIGGSIYEKTENLFYNTSVVFDRSGAMLGKYRKVHIPNDAGFYEQDYFSHGDSYPVFETTFGKVGVLICFDQWYPEPARILRLKGADFIFYPTAIGLVDGIEQTEGSWREAWEGVQRGHAIANSAVVAAVNRVGREGGMQFWGGSFVYGQFGNLVARGGGGETVVLAECDTSLKNDIEDGWGFLRNRKPGSYSELTK